MILEGNDQITVFFANRYICIVAISSFLASTPILFLFLLHSFLPAVNHYLHRTSQQEESTSHTQRHSQHRSNEFSSCAGDIHRTSTPSPIHARITYSLPLSQITRLNKLAGGFSLVKDLRCAREAPEASVGAGNPSRGQGKLFIQLYRPPINFPNHNSSPNLPISFKVMDGVVRR